MCLSNLYNKANLYRRLRHFKKHFKGRFLVKYKFSTLQTYQIRGAFTQVY